LHPGGPPGTPHPLRSAVTRWRSPVPAGRVRGGLGDGLACVGDAAVASTSVALRPDVVVDGGEVVGGVGATVGPCGAVVGGVRSWKSAEVTDSCDAVDDGRLAALPWSARAFGQRGTSGCVIIWGMAKKLRKVAVRGEHGEPHCPECGG